MTAQEPGRAEIVALIERLTREAAHQIARRPKVKLSRALEAHQQRKGKNR